MGKHMDDKFPRNRVYAMGMVVLFLCVLATSMGCTAIVLGSQANVCLTPYSYSKWRTNDKDTKESMKWTSATTDDNNKQWKTMGWYPAPTSATVDGVTWIEADPMNCITECQMNCTAAFTEQAVMLKRKEDGGCLDCLINCTHPWGKNIEECHLSPDCTDEVPRHKGIKNFCLPVARCFQVCAGRGYPKIDAFVGQPNIKAGPIQWQEDASPHDSDKNKNPAPAWTTAGYEKHGKDDVAWYGPKGDNKKLRCMMECEYDGKLTVGFGITAMVLVWLAPLALIIGSGPKELRSICSLVFAVLFWAASLILCTDALLLNMMRHEENNYGGRGWDMLYYERLPTQYDILGGEGGHLKVTFNWMMHVIFGFGLMCNLFTVLAFYDSKEIWNRRTLGEEPEPPRPPSPPREPPKPKPKAMSYYGEEQAKEDEIMNAGAAGLAGTGENQFNVDIGLRWERRTGNNGVDETVIKEIVPGGAADKANNSGMNGTKNRLQPGDVVLLIGNVIDGQEDYTEMQNIYEVPYSEWVRIVRSQPPGTKVRFMFARHSEFMKYQFDILREPIGGSAEPTNEGAGGTNFGNPFPHHAQEEDEEEAGVSLAAMRQGGVNHV